MTVQDFFNKYDNKEAFDEYELKALFNGDFDDDIDDTIHLIETVYGDLDRWTHPITKYYEINGRYFSFFCDEGLTEMQESYYQYQPEEVRKHEYEKTITVVEWEII